MPPAGRSRRVPAPDRRRYYPSVFLSYPKPYSDEQSDFIDRLCSAVQDLGYATRTLGVTDYDMSEPLHAIRRLMAESNGLITVAFRRTYIEAGRSEFKDGSADRSGRWITSPWSHIEPAMAYQLGLPILILREAGVIDDGVLERGVAGIYLPVFELPDRENYLNSEECRQLLADWAFQVKNVVTRKGAPDRLY